MEQPPPIEDIRISFRKPYEPDLHWNLRRAFIEINGEKMERRKLLKLSDKLMNMEFVGQQFSSMCCVGNNPQQTTTTRSGRQETKGLQIHQHRKANPKNQEGAVAQDGAVASLGGTTTASTTEGADRTRSAATRCPSPSVGANLGDSKEAPQRGITRRSSPPEILRRHPLPSSRGTGPTTGSTACSGLIAGANPGTSSRHRATTTRSTLPSAARRKRFTSASSISSRKTGGSSSSCSPKRTNRKFSSMCCTSHKKDCKNGGIHEDLMREYADLTPSPASAERISKDKKLRRKYKKFSKPNVIRGPRYEFDWFAGRWCIYSGYIDSLLLGNGVWQ
ncbi:hypothetical protein DAPPUDRAFT_105049 [Daphnia pulex]|uniref:XRN2-binding (XTBD) domain-containing protein n=1 Tax=Daphnia pulex TaxID=6669 RepID=E9GP90_DAPPU|nr:hypothetical protein DAPPUDRAFT_105049 [Daphnia pulex]|eukprot:EFX78723.1 hypothetical protein DAPPUDRAFT_105049 [Daphnia pulex]